MPVRFFFPIIFGLTLFWGSVWAQPSINVKFEDEIPLEKISFIGVVSSSLDSSLNYVLMSSLFALLDQNPDFQVSDKTEYLSRLASIFERGKDIEPARIREILSRDELDNSIFITFEKYREIFYCRINSYNPVTAKLEILDSMMFVNDIDKRIRKAARHIYHRICLNYGMNIPEKKSSVLYQLTSPIKNARLVRDGIIIKEDSVDEISSDLSLVIKKEAVVRSLGGENFKLILYPNSSYTFLKSSSIFINSGTLGVISINKSFKVFTAALSSSFNNAIVKFSSQDDISHVWVLAGNVSALPTAEKGEPWVLEKKTYTSTRGYRINTYEADDISLKNNFKDFIPVIDSKIIKEFKTPGNLLIEEPVYDVDYFRTDSDDPMEAFIASEFADIGAEPEALSVSGEDWLINEKFLRKGIDETGCYLCVPDHTGIRRP